MDRVSMIAKKWRESMIINGVDVEYLLRLCEVRDADEIRQIVIDEFKMAVMKGPLCQMSDRIDAAAERAFSRLQQFTRNREIL